MQTTINDAMQHASDKIGQSLISLIEEGVYAGNPCINVYLKQSKPTFILPQSIEGYEIQYFLNYQVINENA